MKPAAEGFCTTKTGYYWSAELTYYINVGNITVVSRVSTTVMSLVLSIV